MITDERRAQLLALKVGDVIEDSYGNPAVVVRVDRRGYAPNVTIMQTCGSDRGRRTSPPLWVRPITDRRVEGALDVARDDWRRHVSQVTR